MSILWKASQLNAGYNPLEGLIEDVSLEINAGERVALLGGERSGTYMLLRVLSGLRPRRSGELTVLGEALPLMEYYEDWDHIFSRTQRSRIGVALEKEGLLGNVSLWEGLKTVLRFGSGQGAPETSQRLQKLITNFGLDQVTSLRPHLLSSAERRFASLVRAALHDPDIYIFEGPTKNLEEPDRQRLFEVYDEWFLGGEARSLLVATEDWFFARRYCPRVVVMQAGKIAFDGAWEDLPQALPAYWNTVSASLHKRWAWEDSLRKVV